MLMLQDAPNPFIQPNAGGEPPRHGRHPHAKKLPLARSAPLLCSAQLVRETSFLTIGTASLVSPCIALVDITASGQHRADPGQIAHASRR